MTQETADAPERCGNGDEVTHARGIDLSLWWGKVDPTPIGAQGGRMSISRGPYESVRDAGDALRKVARMDGRGIILQNKNLG